MFKISKNKPKPHKLVVQGYSCDGVTHIDSIFVHVLEHLSELPSGVRVATLDTLASTHRLYGIVTLGKNILLLATPHLKNFVISFPNANCAFVIQCVHFVDSNCFRTIAFLNKKKMITLNNNR